MAITNATWIGCFIEELKFDLLNKPINLFCDNMSAISLIIVKSRANSSKRKHNDVSYHYIQDRGRNKG